MAPWAPSTAPGAPLSPDQIILFGSAARDEMGPHSDVDLLVIKQGEFDAGRLVGDIYLHLHGVGQAVDVILVTPGTSGALPQHALPRHCPRVARGEGNLPCPSACLLRTRENG